MKKASDTYKELYDGLLVPITYLNEMGMDIPEGFRVCAKYTLLSSLDELLVKMKTFDDKQAVKKLLEIKTLANKFGIKLNTSKAPEILSERLLDLIYNLKANVSKKNAQELLSFFDVMAKLDVDVQISVAQNVYYEMFCLDFTEFFEQISKDNTLDTRQIFLLLLEIGRKLNINMNFYQDKIDALTGKV
jgi:hypothetical protein